MSVFTNPASGSVENAKSYVDAILQLLGPKDPIEVLRSTASNLNAAIEGLSDLQLSSPEAPGKWSIRQVIRHLADSDLVWGYRVRMILAHDRPPLTGYDQDLWAERLRYNEADVAESLDEFRAVRRGNLRLIEQASPEDLQRVGVHAERGEERVAHLVRMYAGHDLLHLAQVERIRNAIE
jgi:hypothetical protein